MYQHCLLAELLRSGSSNSKSAVRQTVGRSHEGFEVPPAAGGRGLRNMDGSKPEEKNNYETAKHTLTNKLTTASFVTLDEFHRRKLPPGEALFVSALLKKKKKKKLLLQAMPDQDTMMRNQLLLHQFVAGLPQAGEAKDLAATMERSQTLNITIYMYIYIYTQYIFIQLFCTHLL